LEEWQVAVRSTKGIELDKGERVLVNPRTGEELRISGSDGDAQVQLEDGSWWFHWSDSGSVSFRPPDDFDDANCDVWRIAKELSKKLGARLVGDQGEEYE
jgi:hypothetical protein